MAQWPGSSRILRGRRSPFDEAEAISKWIAAECRRSVLSTMEDLLLDRACLKRRCERRFQVIDVNIQVDRRPMTFIVTDI